MATRLPLEIIEEIFMLLKPSDRLAAAATCSHWFEASLAPRLWKDVTLVIANSMEEAAQIFKGTRRPFHHVKLKDVDFTTSCSRVIDFWNHICPSITTLEIHQSFMSEASLINMLLLCPSLQSLHFHDCRDTFITGKLFSNPLVMRQICLALPDLKEICLADNCSYLSDALLDRFMSLVSSSHLKCLTLAGTAISFHPGIRKKFYPETVEDGVAGNSKCSELVLTYDCILEHISQHSSAIKYLDFSRTLINDKACTALSEVADLKLNSLLMKGCEVTNTGIASICASQTNLVHLDVGLCVRLTDTALISISSRLLNLRSLCLQNCRAITDVGIACLGQLSQLSDVNLQGLERITSVGLAQGLLNRQNRSLRRITLSATRITEDAIDLLATNGPNLTYLDLTSCVKAVTDSSLPALWRSLKLLRELHLDYCSGLTDSAFQSENKDSIASNLPSLSYLSLSGCNKITDKSLQEAFDFKDLKHLNLNACSLITDAGLVGMSQHNKGLEILVLNYCHKICDSGMIASIQHLARLSRLELHGCVKLTGRTLEAIESRPLVYLTYLDVSHCKLMTFERVDRLQMRMSAVREVLSSGLD